jgi:hypothetical protein
MRQFAQSNLRILFLSVYIPLSVSVGILHSDELFSGGNGHLTLQKQSPQALTKSLDNGFCLACLFTAGHIGIQEPFVPVLSSNRAEAFDGILISTESPPQPHSARAPPVSPLL